MQLVLPLDDRSRTLVEIDERLQSCFGPLEPCFRLDPISQLVLGLIGGRTDGEVSKAAFEALVLRYGSWAGVRDAPVASVLKVIRRVTFAEAKAPRLKAALLAVTRANGGLTLRNLERLSVDQALAWLERLPGVGRKTAAATLNFSTLCRPALVIDTHHLRALRRLGLVSPRAGIAEAYECMMPLAPQRWQAAEFDRHHQLFKRLGQEICGHAAPRCGGCPLCELCPTAIAGAPGGSRSSLR